MEGIAGWDGFSQIVPVLELCIAGYCLYRLVKPFLRDAKAALATGGTYFFTMLGLYAMPLYTDAFIAYQSFNPHNLTFLRCLKFFPTGMWVGF